MEQQNHPQGAIGRRSLITATGAALVGGLVGCSAAKVTPPSTGGVNAGVPTA
jgi:hypothetical protein